MQPSPVDTIVAWSGAIVNIPTGWALCNGANGTPDLRDRFVVGAGTTFNPTDTGGSVNHNHTFTGTSHAHGSDPGAAINGGAPKSSTSDPASTTGTTDNTNGLPPYFSLAYIMFIGD